MAVFGSALTPIQPSPLSPAPMGVRGFGQKLADGIKTVGGIFSTAKTGYEVGKMIWEGGKNGVSIYPLKWFKHLVHIIYI